MLPIFYLMIEDIKLIENAYAFLISVNLRAFLSFKNIYIFSIA